MQQVKNIIIGFGKGGKTLAKFLAQKGKEVLVVEKSKQMYGGTCINIACLPSKRLIIEAANGVDFVDAVKSKNEMTTMLRNKNYHMLADEPTVTVLDGTARFVGNHQIQVATDDGIQKFTGERIFINTGAQPNIPDVPGLKESSAVLDSTSAMDQTSLPQQLVIIGGGYIGLEFASMFTEYGSVVTVLDSHQDILPHEDNDIRKAVKGDLQDAGIKFKLNSKLLEVKDNVVIYEQAGERRQIIADRILIATGRHANTAALGLENTDIQLDQHGNVKVNDLLQTTVDNVWAIGDVKGGPQFTYISLDDFRIIRDQLFGDGQRQVSDRINVPTAVFLNPPLSQVGLTEKMAQSQNIKYQLKKLPVAAIPKARVLEEPRGLFKALINPENGEILGATLYGPESHELINTVSLAINNHIPARVLAEQIYTHPTMMEAFNDLFN